MNVPRPEPAGVWLADGRPVRFIWRGRLYTVLAIVDRPEPDASPRSWRVLASPGKNVPPAQFRLWHDPATDDWLLARDAG